MRKIKIVFMSIAVIAAVGSALAGKPDSSCEDFPQYYKTAFGYAPAGDFGVSYYCLNTAGVCTYYRPNPVTQPNTYVPCRLGIYQPVFLGVKENTQVKAPR